MSENTKITVTNFVEKYKFLKSNDAKKNLVKTIMINDKYVDYLVKQKYAKDIITISCIDKNGYVKVNSCKKYMMYVMTLVDLYTTIEVSENNCVSEFDMLDKENLIDAILGCIDKNELTKFDTIMQMCFDDFMTNNYETHAFITNIVNKSVSNILESANNIVESVSPLAEKLISKLDNLSDEDIENLINVLSKYGKFIK